MKPFGWAYIGTGGIAHTTAKELAQGGGRVVAVWNRTREKAEQFAALYGAAVYDTPEEAITAPEVEGVYIAVTANLHDQYMKRCIALGKPVLCEKPFTVNARQARQVFDLAAEKGIYVSEAMWTWFNPVAKQVKYWVDSGALGRIRHVNCTYSFPMIHSPYKKPRHTSAELIGGALLDTGIYGIRYCYALFGMPEKIHCQGRVVDGIDLGESITLDYDGFQACFLFSRDQNHGETFEIQGDNGTISVPMFHCARKAVLKGTVSGKIRDKGPQFARQFAGVSREIRSGAETALTISPESTLQVLEILDECRNQMGLKYPCELE